MVKMIIILSLFFGLQSNAQEPILKVGSRFPDLTITHISNAPENEFYLNKAKDKRYFILNFWGTWCSPCIPEMDTLAKLQTHNAGKIQVIAISDDNEERKLKYMKNKPSDIWLATDTSYTLYNMLSLSSVGQSAIVSADKMIVALVRTDSINQQMIDKLLRGEIISMSAGIKEKMIPASGEAFGVDSLTAHSFSIRGYKKGQQSMSRTYLEHETYNGRRITWFNVSIGLLYRAAYGIKSFLKQEIYDSSVSREEVNNYDMKNKAATYCVDLLVKPEQSDSLYIILQQYLNLYMPIRARLEKRLMEVFILKQKPGMSISLTPSVAEKSSFEFNGRGYNGIKVSLADFAKNYLTNELECPVVDESGYPGNYDIQTDVEQRDKAGILKSIEKLGLTVEKAKREMPVIVYYK
jgi:uncharacterized protein (TIGR03435 family)